MTEDADLKHLGRRLRECDRLRRVLRRAHRRLDESEEIWVPSIQGHARDRLGEAVRLEVVRAALWNLALAGAQVVEEALE